MKRMLFILLTAIVLVDLFQLDEKTLTNNTNKNSKVSLLGSNVLTQQEHLLPDEIDLEIILFFPIVTNEIPPVTSSLDEVSLTITSPVMPGDLVASKPGDANQLATSFSLDPFEEFMIISIPFGLSSPVEDLPTATPGGAESYRTALNTIRSDRKSTRLNSSHRT